MPPPMPESTPIALMPGVRAALLDMARRAAPRECCGVLLGRADGGGAPLQIAAAEPLANAELRDPGTRFRIDPGELAALARAARARALDVVGFFHSHPDGPARPSAEDVAEASAWPGTLHVILAPVGDELRLYETGTTTWYERQPLQARP